MKTVNLKGLWTTFLSCAVIATVAFDPSSAPAAITQSFTATGMTSEATPHVISGTAGFDVSSSGQIKLTLTNTSPVTYDPGETLTGISFTITNGSTTLTVTSIVSDTAVLRTVNGDGTYSNGAIADIGWALQSTNYLRFNGGSAIIGPANGEVGPNTGTYSSAGGGIAGNAGHNPFAGRSAEFVLLVPGSTTGTIISNVTLRFGTTYENVVPVPEPGSLAVFGIGLGVACLSSRVRRFSKR